MEAILIDIQDLSIILLLVECNIMKGTSLMVLGSNKASQIGFVFAKHFYIFEASSTFDFGKMCICDNSTFKFLNCDRYKAIAQTKCILVLGGFFYQHCFLHTRESC